MAIWPFRKQTTVKYDPDLPPEVQAYTKAERREKMGMAWLVGVISLVVTALIFTGLFFGGRWVYQKITGDSQSTTQTVSNEDQAAEQKKKDEEAAKKAEEEKNRTSGGAANATDTPAPATTPTTPTTNSQTSQPPVTPQIPRTGPDLDL